MTETQTETKEIRPPAKRKQKKRSAKKAPAPKTETSPYAGITAKACPTACTSERCVISTVAVCKHPFKSSMNGCGPVTMSNRDKAKKMIRHQIVELKS